MQLRLLTVRLQVLRRSELPLAHQAHLRLRLLESDQLAQSLQLLQRLLVIPTVLRGAADARCLVREVSRLRLLQLRIHCVLLNLQLQRRLRVIEYRVRKVPVLYRKTPVDRRRRVESLLLIRFLAHRFYYFLFRYYSISFYLLS